MKRLFLRHIQIASLEDTQTCIRMNFKGATKLTLLGLNEHSWLSRSTKQAKIDKNLSKQTRNFKSLKSLNIKSIDFSLRPSKATQFVKSMYHIEKLCLKHNSNEQTMFRAKTPIKDKVWFKFIKRLREVDYNLLDTTRDDKPLETFKLMIYHQLNVKMLQIQLPSEEIYPEKKFWKSLLRLKKLESLAIDGGIFAKQINSHQYDLKKTLKSLAFTFHHESSVIFVSSAVKLATQLSKLRALNLTFTNDAVPTVTSDCCMLSQLHHLRKVNFEFNMSSGHSQGISSYLDAVQNHPLTHLGLRCSINKDANLAPISHFLKKRKGLESLELKIVNLNLFKGNGEFVKVANSIGRCENLKFLDLVFTTTGKNLKKAVFPKALGEEFVLSLSKLKDLEDLKLECNQFDADSIVLEILYALGKNAGKMKCLELEIGKYVLDNNNEFGKILIVMSAFEKISSLKIWSLEVQNSIQLNGLAGCISDLHNLREFAFGNIHNDLTKMEVVEGIKRILARRTLSSFYWKISKDFLNNYSWSEISRKEIAKINPFLKDYSADLRRILNKNKFHSNDDSSDEEEFGDDEGL